MNTSLLRQTWDLIEGTNAGELLESSESELVCRLVQRLEEHKPLEEQERTCVNNYLHAKMNLIRDTAESRLVAV